jgi:hypothetical protein
MSEVTTEILVEECQLCHRPSTDHGPGRIKHKFVGLEGPRGLRVETTAGDQAPKGGPASQGPVRSLLGGDPILRLALIRKGLVTADEIAGIEAELRGAGIAVAEAVVQP